MAVPGPRPPPSSGRVSPSTALGPAATEGPRIVDSLDDMLERAKGECCTGSGPGGPAADAGGSISRTILSRSIMAAGADAAGGGPDRRGATAAAAAAAAAGAVAEREPPGVGRTAVLEPYHRSPEDDVDTLTRTYRQLFHLRLRPRAASRGRKGQPSR